MPLLQLPLPTLADSLFRIRRSLDTEYADVRRQDGTPVSSFDRASNLYPLSNTLARLEQQLLLLCREQASQATPFGATGPNLDAWLARYGITPAEPATATGLIELTGTNQATIPAGTQVTTASGRNYTIDEAVIFGPEPSTAQATVTAEAIGADYNLHPGDSLQLAIIDDDIEPDVTWLKTNSPGSDPADEAAKQALLQKRLAQGDAIGTPIGYQLAALRADPQLDTVYIVEAGRGPGTVLIYPTDRLGPGDDPWTVLIPPAGRIAAIQTALEHPSARGANHRIVVEALPLIPTTFTLQVTPDTSDTRTAVTEQLGHRLAASYNPRGYTIPNSELGAAIGAATGVTDHTILAIGAGDGTSDLVAEFGTLATLGAITWD